MCKENFKKEEINASSNEQLTNPNEKPKKTEFEELLEDLRMEQNELH